VSRMN